MPCREIGLIVHIAIAAPATLSVLADSLGFEPTIPGYPFPGTSYLALEYLALGHQVTLVSTSPGLAQPVVWNRGDLTVRIVASRPSARQRALDLFRLEREGIANQLMVSNPDVIHAHWTYEFGLATQTVQLPRVVTVHDWAPAVARQNRHPYWWFRAVMQHECLRDRRTVFSAPSEYLAKKVRKVVPSCLTIPNGIPAGTPRQRRPTSRPPADGATVGMLNVGFSRRKNVQAALTAWPHIRAKHPGARLHLAGPGFEPDGEAQSWAANRGLTCGVRFMGPIAPSELDRWMASLDLFLHTSKEESFGLVLVEAMREGIPVIAGMSSGAVPDIVDNSGILVDVNSQAQLIAAVSRLIDDPALRASLAVRGRTRATEFDLREVALRYEAALEGALVGW